MRLIEQEIPIRQDECGQINPPGDSSVALNMVQKWLHHAQLATTSIYADAQGAEGVQLAREQMWN
jgi:hypothetical protein